MKLFGSLFLLGALLSGQASADQLAVHGMVLFGKNATYASHLPMFHNPHNYQVILKVQFHHPKYEQLKAQGESLFTLAPQPLDLTKIINGQITQFKAHLFQGHFEQGGTDLGLVMVGIEKVVFSSPLNPTTPEGAQYLVFGQAGEYFAAHVINGKPSFDTILSVSQPYALNEVFCRTRACSGVQQIPTPDSSLPVTLAFGPSANGAKAEGGNQLGQFGGTLSDVKQVLYFEEGDLSHSQQ